MKANDIMKLVIGIILIDIFITQAQSGIKWEEIFNSSAIPAGWEVIDNDASGDSLELIQFLTLTGGATIFPQAGSYFWSSNYYNANLAGVIDEWLISPQISVIYAGDSLYFWAGAIGGAFHDSLRVWVSVTDNQISSFNHLLGYFKVDGPAGSWHRYGFDLTPFDSSDIYFAINYYIRDGGSGGQHSDHVWIDHVWITGDPTTINQPPTVFYLLNPPNAQFLHPVTDSTIHFKWTSSHDLNGDTLRYKLKILNTFPVLTFNGILDTTFNLNWHGILDYYTLYPWTMSVTDGKSTVFSPDTFLFITPPMENLAPFPFSLYSPSDGDTLSPTDTIVFQWRKAIDPNSDTLTYALNLSGSNLDTTFEDITDTTISVCGSGILSAGNEYQWKVVASDSQFSTSCLTNWNFHTSGAVGIEDDFVWIPDHSVLWQNYPNPFNPVTQINYHLTNSGYVRLTIHNSVGQEINTLVDEYQNSGWQSVLWRGINNRGQQVASGVYYYRIQSGNFVQTRKMLLLR